jgi:hypothetical protein
MSSEISIERGPLKASAAGSTSGELASPRTADEGFRPWHFFVLASILLATGAVIMARQSAPEHLILISFTIAAAGGAAAALYRMLVPLTTPLVLRMGAPVSERTRVALEREKALVLRSIKELEFDRAMGKVSQQDFDEMAGRLRARALSLMKQLDLGSAGYAVAIEEELRKRSHGSRSPAVQVSVQSVQGDSACGCGTANDPDAVFCKKCGTRLGA